MKDFSCLLLLILYFLTLLIGTVVLVQQYNWSPWWFLVTMLMCSVKYKSSKD